MTSSLSEWFTGLHSRPHARMRLFCLPHGGGNAQAYRSWANGCDQSIEVVGVELPGRGRRFREPHFDDMQGLVGALADAMAPNLDRPYALFGHSVGGLVAFEAALELEARAASTRWLEGPCHLVVSGYPSPAHAAQSAPMHTLDDQALLTEVGRFGVLDGADELGDELRRLVLDATRADFRLAETHRVQDDARLESRLTVLAGCDDEIAPPESMTEWAGYAPAGFETRVFPGGHFFTETAEADVLACLFEVVHASLDARPPSMLVGAEVELESEDCLHDLFRAQAKRTPNATAVVGVDRSMTFAELDEGSDRLAARLAGLGCGPDKLVAIHLETGVDFIVAYIAAHKAGGAYLPIPIDTPDEQIADILEAMSPVAYVTRTSLENHMPVGWRGCSRAVLIDGPGAMWHGGSVFKSPEVDLDNLAYAVMTSGTTGKPKGIACPHRGAVNSYAWRYRHLPYEGDEREACNVFFVWEVLRPLLKGQPAYIIPDDVIYDVRRLVAFLRDHAITRVLLTPSLFEQVLALGGDRLAQDLSVMRVVILNGEVVSPALVQKAARLLPHVRLVNDYSISECHDVTHGDLVSERLRVSSGAVMDNVRIYVLDDDGQPVPRGVRGEIYVSGAGLARGYLNAPEESALRFLPDTILPEGAFGRKAMMFRTGDVGRIAPDGQLEVVGRAHFMIKLRGYSVVPGAVEAEILSFSAISAAHVTTCNDGATGQPVELVAYVAGQGGRPTAAQICELREFLKRRLPDYARPSRFIAMSALPVCAKTGKLDRKQLPPLPAVEPVAEARDGRRPPVDRTERMADVWASVLGVDGVSAGNNFFDLGGHSLKAGELVAAVEKAFGRRCDVVDVFDRPVLRDFVDHVLGTDAVSSVPAETRRGDENARLRGISKNDDIAVIGLSCRFPGADTPEAFWRNIASGTSVLRRFSDDELARFGVPRNVREDERYVPVGAIVDDVASFDPRFWGLSAREATLMDPQQRLFLECAWHALEHAGHRPTDVGGRIGVFAGCYLPGYLIHHLGASAHLNPGDPTGFHLAEIGNDKDYLASRTAYLMNLNGPAISVQTSCSTGLVAIAEAVKALRVGQCDMALAGASSLSFPQGGFTAAEGHIGTSTGVCRAFDERADGTILGDGVGVVALRPLSSALADGDNVLAVIKGYCVNNDGADKAGYSAPSLRGQASCIAGALRDAQVDAGSIGYVEAHGTGTRIGDPIEVRALTQAFREGGARQTAACALGSVKPNIGHANIAAGAAGFIKAVLALKNGVIPPLINYERANPDMQLADTPFYIADRLRPWLVEGDTPRRAGVSSFGIGGTNCHVVLEEAPAATRKATPEMAAYVFPVSAKSVASLAASANELARHLGETGNEPLSDIAATLQRGRAVFCERRAVVADTREELCNQLAEIGQGRVPGSPTSGKVAFLFPGQGSQFVGMGEPLYRGLRAYRRHFDRCADLFNDEGVADLGQVFEGERCARLLSRPSGLQPAVFATSFATMSVLADLGVKPEIVLGHSLGEYAAAVCAGVLCLEDAVKLVAARAAATEDIEMGAMTTVVVDPGTALGLTRDVPGVVVAALNGERECVLAGPVSALQEVERIAQLEGFAAKRLPVSHAFHSPMMEPAADRLGQAAQGVVHDASDVMFISNVTGRPLAEGERLDSGYWPRQMLSPVRFTDCAEVLLAQEPVTVVEVGPGNILSRLVRRAARGRAGVHPKIIETLPQGRRPGNGSSEAEGMRLFLGAAAAAFEAGRDINWGVLNDGRPFRRVALPGYAFERQRCWPDNDLAQREKETRHRSHNTQSSEQVVPWADRFYVPSWRRGAPAGVGHGSEVVGQVRRLLALLPDASGDARRFALRVIAELRRGGCIVETIEPASERETISNLVERGVLPADVIDLAGLSVGDPVAATERIVRLSMLLRSESLHLCVVTAGAFSVMGEDLDADAAALPSAALVAAQENPSLNVSVIDVPREAIGNRREMGRLAEELKTELLAENPRREAFIALRRGHVWVEQYEPIDLGSGARAAGRKRLRGRDGVYLITGGFGRIGLALARHLAGLGCRVALASRREIAPRAEWAELCAGSSNDNATCGDLYRVLHELDQTGCLAEVASVDVADGPSLLGVMSELMRDHGGIAGVFHAAGLADLRYQEDTTRETIAAEFASKRDGSQALGEAIDALRRQGHEEPTFVLAFSSLAAVLGGYGMSGYAGANRSLEAICDNATRTGKTPWISVAWDDWDFEYGKEQVAAYAQTRTGLAMPVTDGLSAIEAVLGGAPVTNVAVSMTPLEQRLSRWRDRPRDLRHSDTLTPTVNANPRVDGVRPIAETRPAEALSSTEDGVMAAYSAVLGATGFDADAGFFDLGGDSLLAAELVVAIGKTLAVRPTIADVLENPTPRSLAAALDAKTIKGDPTSHSATG